MPNALRPYRQVARAASAEETRRRIVNAFEAALHDRLMDDITLDQIATAAETTRQTVIRLFGGKDGLVEAFIGKFHHEVLDRRVLPERATPDAAAQALFAVYEALGDFVIRMLAQEERHPVLSVWLDHGRANHRAWTAGTFASALPAAPAARESLVTQLVIAGDVYTWKLLRRDNKLSVEAGQALMASMFAKLIRKG